MLLKSFILTSLLSLIMVACGETSKDEKSPKVGEQAIEQWKPFENVGEAIKTAESDATKSSAEFSDEEPCDQFVADPKTGLMVYKECEESEEKE